MSNFPALKTGAVAQYPLQAATRYSTQEVLFLDGSRQAYALAAPLRRWAIAVKKLDVAEVSAIHDFLDLQQGAPFSFTDPVSGSIAQKCLVRGFCSTDLDADLRAQIQLTIEEVL